MHQQYHYATPAVVIGRHQWRMVVKDSVYGGRSTEYQWRSTGSQPWRPDKEWPSYNSNDGTYAGCPHSLRDRIWEPNLMAIQAALDGKNGDLFAWGNETSIADVTSVVPVLPDRLLDGVQRAYTIDVLSSQSKPDLNHPDERRLMCWVLPPWQRQEKWSTFQKVRFVEGIFLGLGTGFYVVHGSDYRPDGTAKPMSGWLIDGQQRIAAIRDFLNGDLAIFNGVRWADLDKGTQRRRFLHVGFPAIEIAYTADERRLMELSNRLNFGGTPHEPSEMALVPAFAMSAN